MTSQLLKPATRRKITNAVRLAKLAGIVGAGAFVVWFFATYPKQIIAGGVVVVIIALMAAVVIIAQAKAADRTMPSVAEWNARAQTLRDEEEQAKKEQKADQSD